MLFCIVTCVVLLFIFITVVWIAPFYKFKEPYPNKKIYPREKPDVEEKKFLIENV